MKAHELLGMAEPRSVFERLAMTGTACTDVEERRPYFRKHKEVSLTRPSVQIVSAQKAAAIKAAEEIRRIANAAAASNRIRATQAVSSAVISRRAADAAAKAAQEAEAEARAAHRAKLLEQCQLASEEARTSTESSTVSKLRGLVDEARRIKATDSLQLAQAAYNVAARKATAREKNARLVARWEVEIEAECAAEAREEEGHDAAQWNDGAPARGDGLEAVAAAAAAAEALADEADAATAALPSTVAARARPRSAVPASDRAASAARPTTAWAARPATGGMGALASLMQADLASLSHRLGVPAELAGSLADGPPPVLPVPPERLEVMRASLKLVMHALTHKLKLEASALELEAARAAFRSWASTSWLDPRTFETRTKPASCWTMEQYAMPGFSALYAQRLHVPRVAAARQAVLWMLECAPGVPSDAPLSMADLGAGTCAACLGALLALHEHAGDEQVRRPPIAC